MSPKTILITGGNRGIGFGIVQALAQKSTENTIIIASRKKSDADEAICEAQKLGYSNPFHALSLDVTSDDSVDAAVEEVERTFGRLDVLINNAGLGLFEDKDSTATWRDAWTRVLDTNVTSVRLVTYTFLPLLRLCPSPRVINISSARGSFALSSSGSNPPTASLPYSVSKAALNMLTLEMGKAEPEVRFYAVSPGHCRTAFNGFRGKKEPVEGGRCAAELAVAGRGMYGNGFWEFEHEEMEEVGW